MYILFTSLLYFSELHIYHKIEEEGAEEESVEGGRGEGNNGMVRGGEHDEGFVEGSV